MQPKIINNDLRNLGLVELDELEAGNFFLVNYILYQVSWHGTKRYYSRVSSGELFTPEDFGEDEDLVEVRDVEIIHKRG